MVEKRRASAPIQQQREPNWPLRPSVAACISESFAVSNLSINIIKDTNDAVILPIQIEYHFTRYTFKAFSCLSLASWAQVSRRKMYASGKYADVSNNKFHFDHSCRSSNYKQVLKHVDSRVCHCSPAPVKTINIFTIAAFDGQLRFGSRHINKVLSLRIANIKQECATNTTNL